MKNAVVLLSGGLDSSTTLAIAQAQGFNVKALTIFYGQRNQVELDAARRVVKHFAVDKHQVLDLDLRAFGGSSLTDSIEVLAHSEISSEAIPQTYVPARNTIMLSLALAYAEVNQAFDIFFGANIHDYSGYPDCRPHYVEAFEKMANLATKSACEGGNKITIHTPLINLTKAQIIKRGIELGVDYSITHSCYDPVGDRACGRCSACFYRTKGFKDADILDPTPYAATK
ncbi:MAG: 7-cyano-7-deazaguanine synthase QueC [Myxococcales bacterium]|nr:MAG: 7-cyano-7-deazaguanine synthase QueC [Myxococcales bacterium]